MLAWGARAGVLLAHHAEDRAHRPARLAGAALAVAVALLDGVDELIAAKDQFRAGSVRPGDVVEPQVLAADVRIVADDLAGVERARGVEDLLDLPHQVVERPVLVLDVGHP